MKFLGNMGVSPVTIEALRQRGYDAMHLVEEGLERLPDSDILIKARMEERIILTFDLDFGDLLAASKAELPSVIIFRLQTAKPDFVLSRLLSVLSVCERELVVGTIVIIEDNRYRLRRLPI